MVHKDLRVELEGRRDTAAQLGAALVELEQHPGFPTIADDAMTGVTRERCRAARHTLSGLWHDYNTCHAHLDAAQALGRGAAADAELRRLLRTDSVEVEPLPDPAGGTTTPAIERLTPAALLDRMETALGEVADVVVSCDRVRRSYLGVMIPLADRLQTLATTAAALDPDELAADLAAAQAQLGELEQAVVFDPLGLADQPADDALSPIVLAADAVEARCHELAALSAGWDQALADAEAVLANAQQLAHRTRSSELRATELFGRTQQLASSLNRRAEGLRARLSAIPALRTWPARQAELASWGEAARDLVVELDRATELADGLLERRSELRGRFAAYRVKVVRLGMAERPDLLAADRRIEDLLWSRPCDVAAATRALADYQKLIRALEEGP